MVATKPFSKIWNNSLSLTKLRLNYHIYWTFQTFCKERQRGRQKWLLPLNINITILKSKLLSSIAWIDPNFPIWYNISKISKFSMDYNVYGRILLADARSKHTHHNGHRFSEFQKVTEIWTKREQNTEEPIDYW